MGLGGHAPRLRSRAYIRTVSLLMPCLLNGSHSVSEVEGGEGGGVGVTGQLSSRMQLMLCCVPTYPLVPQAHTTRLEAQQGDVAMLSGSLGVTTLPRSGRITSPPTLSFLKRKRSGVSYRHSLSCQHEGSSGDIQVLTSDLQTPQ